MIVDYSTIRPPVSALTALGVTAVGRYIGWDDQPGFSSIGKNLTRAEAAALHAAGISIWLAFEYAADAAAGGAAQGTKDGQLAAAQLAQLGAPPGIGVYFALDWDIPDYAPGLPDTPASAAVKLGPVAAYFRAIRALKPAYQVGGYGGYYAVKRLFDAGLITLGWQTIAWSGGHIDPRAHLYQAGTVALAGADLNVHEGAAADFGQWPSGVTADWTEEMIMTLLPTLQQGSHDAVGQPLYVHRVQLLVSGIGTWNNLGHSTQVAPNGSFDAATKAAVEAVQRFFGFRGADVDGVVGPKTWHKLITGQ